MKSSGATLDKKKWYKNAMAAIAAIGALLGVAASLRPYLTTRPNAVRDSTEIVLDASEAMNQEFEGTTKIQAAADAARLILGNVIAKEDNLALRQFGGPCEGDNTQLTVKIATKNLDRVRSALQTVQPAGQSALTHAVIEAIGDFNDPKRFKGKRILVITGSDEACFLSGSSSDPMREATAAIKDRLDRVKRSGDNIQLDFHFVGIGLTPQQEKKLEAVATATGGKPKFVHHLAELKKVILTDVQATPAETASVVRDGQSLVDALNACGKRLSDVLTDIQNEDYSAAGDSLSKAGEEWARSESPFLELGKKQGADQFEKLYSLAKQNREIEERLIALAKIMLSKARAHDPAAYNHLRPDFDRLSSDYERNGQEITRLLNELK